MGRRARRSRKPSKRELLRRFSFDFERLNQRMHNKVMIVDGQVAIVGGRNVQSCYFDMDPAFVYLDRDALAIGPAVADAARSFEAYWNWRRHIPVLTEINQILASISRSLPILDIWPFRVSSMYELEDGADAVPTDSGEFHHNYRVVGQFPGEESRKRRVFVRFYGAFLGFTTSLL